MFFQGGQKSHLHNKNLEMQNEGSKSFGTALN